jgi:hypothetical protein
MPDLIEAVVLVCLIFFLGFVLGALAVTLARRTRNGRNSR